MKRDDMAKSVGVARIKISGIEISVYVLDNGMRVIDPEDFNRLMAKWSTELPSSEDMLMVGTILGE